MIRELLASVRLTVVTVIVCCVAYPLGVLAFALVAAPETRLGSLVAGKDGAPAGSRLVAQAFTRPEYFWPRPSACDYDASAAAGSNLSPASPQLRQRAEEILARLKAEPQADGNSQEAKTRRADASTLAAQVPAELVTASGSGLDPHISLAGALVQAQRVANRRNVGENEIRRLVERHVDWNAPAALGGVPLVNVLLLNLALDEAHPVP